LLLCSNSDPKRTFASDFANMKVIGDIEHAAWCGVLDFCIAHVEERHTDLIDSQPDLFEPHRMSRVVIIGNAGAGKSTLARKLAARRGLPHIEVDRLLWEEGWKIAPTEVYERQHAEAIAGDRWVIDGLGRRASIPDRVSRATEIILIDMPLWIHFWLAAERQIAWTRGSIDHPPGGIAQMPPTQGLFQAIWEVEHDWMPAIRSLCDEAEVRGKIVVRLADVQALDDFAGIL